MGKLTRIYLELERRVSVTRAAKEENSAEEKAYLDVMDLLWWEMSEDERNLLEIRPPEKKGNGVM